MAGEAVEPFGDERADLRAAWMTRELMSVWASEMNDAVYRELLERLLGYLKVNQPQEQILSPEQAAKMMGR